MNPAEERNRPFMKRIVSLLLMLALTLSLTACAAAPAASTGPVETTPTAPIETTSTGPTVVTLVDQAGREVVLEKAAERIVSCYYITTYATMALGVSDRIVGLEKKADSRPIYHMAAPALLELPNVGSLKEFNLEAAISLEPDLVLMPMKLKEHAETLTGLGINVLVVNPETQADLVDMLHLIAAACGVEEKADALLGYYNKQLTLISAMTANAEKPKVYFASNSSYLETAPAGMYQSDLITLAGGTNVAAGLPGDYWTAVSYESILTMNPDVIIVPCGASYTRDDILADVQLADTAAVKNGAVYQMPQKIEEWDSPIPSGILGVMWLTSVLHEDVYPFADFQKDVSGYYEQFYGFTMDAALITK